MLYTSKDYPEGFKLNDAAFSFNPKNITLNVAHAEFAGSHITAKGTLENVIGFMTKNETISGMLDLYADEIDLNKFMSSVPATADTVKNKTAASIFEVPKNISFVVQAKVDQLHYDNVDYRNLSGALAIHDEIIALKDVKMDALGGSLTARGYYSTQKDKKNPDISFSYDVHGVDIQKTFYAYNTVRKSCPWGSM